METGTGPYLVIRRDDGYGDVIALEVGQRCTLGRANTNRIVLKDELCSREHAEVYFAEERWRLRDLKSLNGTRVNGDAITDEWELVSGDEFQVGRTRFVYVDQLEELPHVSLAAPGETISIKKRLSQSRFMTPNPEVETGGHVARTAPLSRAIPIIRIAASVGTWPSCTASAWRWERRRPTRSWPTSCSTACSRRSMPRSAPF